MAYSPKPTGADNQGFVDIVATTEAYAGLRDDGTIFAWGHINNGGQGNYAAAMPPTGNDFVKILSVGKGFVAMRDDGSMQGWGTANAGDVQMPTDAGYVDIARGVSANCAMRSDGSMSCFGASTHGATGYPATPGWTVTSGAVSFSALNIDGTVTAWGIGPLGGHNTPTDSGYVEMLVARDGYTGIKADGSLTNWGLSTSLPDWVDAPTGTGYSSVVAGANAFSAFDSSGLVVMWGDVPATHTQPPADTDIVSITAGATGFVGIKADGSVLQWGQVGGVHPALTPAPTDTGYVAVSANSDAYVGLKADGSITSWQSNANGGSSIDGTGYTGSPSGNDFVDIDGEVNGICPGGMPIDVLVDIPPTAPGGVDVDLQLWLKADADVANTGEGTDVTAWTDQVDSNNIFADTASSTGEPNYLGTGLNFNPSLEFTGVDYLEIEGDAFTGDFSTGGFDVFYVTQAPAVTSFDTALYLGADFPQNGGRGLSFAQVTSDRGSLMGLQDSGTAHDLTEWDATNTNYSAHIWNVADADKNNVHTTANLYADGEFITGNNISGDATWDGNTVNAIVGNSMRNTGVDCESCRFNGEIAEIIAYSNENGSTDRQRIQSYLALKYGITLTKAGSASGEYISSDGTPVWSSADHHNDVFGIGQDDVGALSQRVSTSVNATGIVTVASDNDFTGANQDAARTSLGDGNFIVMGDNAGNAAWTTTGAPVGYELLEKTWLVQETGTVGSVSIQFDVADTDYDVPATYMGDYYMVVDTNDDTDLSDETIAGGGIMPLTNISGDLWSAAVDFADGAIFSLASANDPFAPSAPTIDPVEDGDTTVTGQAEPGATVTLEDPTSPGTSLCANDPIVADAAGNYTCDLVTPAVGGDEIEATATDPAGNTSNPATTTVFDPTTESDTPTINAVDDDDTVVTGRAESGSVIDLTDNGTPIACTNAPVTADVSGNWRCDLPGTLTDGNTVEAVATAPGEKPSAPASTIVSGASTTAPTAPTVNPTNGEPVAGSCSGTGQTVTVLNTTTANTVVCTTTSGTNGDFSCSPVTPLPSDADILAVTCSDGVSTSNPTTVVVDQNAPSAPTINPVSTSDTEVTGTAEPGATVNITGVTCTNTPVTADAAGNYSCTLATPAPDGTVITATATDPAGNTSDPATTTVFDPTTESDTPTIDAVHTTDTEVIGSAEPGATVTLTDNGVAIACTNAPVTADVAGNWSCDLPTTIAAGNTVAAVATAPGENASSPVTTDVSDALVTAPGAPTVNPTNGEPVAGSCSGTGQTVTVLNTTTANTVVCTTTSGTNGDFSCSPVTPLPSDADILAVTCSDGVSTSNPTTVVVDQNAPSTPTINAVDDNDTSVTGTAEPGATVNITGVTCTNAPVIADAAGNYTCTLATPAVAGTVITATATDPAGNTSGSAQVTVTTADDHAPQAPTINPVSTSDTEVTGTAEPGATVNITGVTCTNTPVTADAAGNYSCTLATPAPDGTVITATATDPAGNESESVTTTVSDPATKTDTPMIGAVDDDDTTVTGTAEPGATVILSDGGTAIACTNAPVTADILGNWSCTLPATETVGDVITASATAAGENPSNPASTTVSGASTTAPTAPTVDPTNGEPVTGSCSGAGQTVTVFNTSTANTEICTTTSGAGGAFACTPVSPVPADGAVLAVTCSIGINSSGPSVVVVDGIAPSTPNAPALQANSDTGVADSDNTTSDTTPTFDVKCTELGSTITLYSDNPNTGTVIGTHQCIEIGAASVTAFALADGVHNVAVTETDLVGNTSSKSSSVAVTIDSVPPATPRINSAEIGVTVVTGTAEPGAIITLVDIACSNAPVVVDNSGDWTCTLSAPTVEGDVLVANAADISGNVSGLSAPAKDTTSVHRFWSEEYRGHFFTISEGEKDEVIARYADNIWRYEGIAYEGYTRSRSSSTPVYRFWSETFRGHFYTVSEAEKIATEQDPNWTYEGIDWYTNNFVSSTTRPVYRFWSENYKHHFYTQTEEEKDFIILNDGENWTFEGKVWNAPEQEGL